MCFQIFKFCLLVLVIFFITINDSSDGLECGTRKVRVNEVIVSGKSTSPGEWPWHVALYHLDSTADNYVCGGTLISETFVLTADHCVRENNHVLSVKRIFVRLGVYNLRDINRKTFQQHKIRRIHTYGNSKKLRNDIALLELSTQADFDDFVQPACVNYEKDLTGQFGTAVGWGFDETFKPSQTLKSQRMPVVTTNDCLEVNDGAFRHALDSSIFCAGYTNGTTVCNGDSGGGIHFERNNNRWYVGGIISFTTPQEDSDLCHLKSYAAFTNVERFLPWINQIVDFGRIETGRSSSPIMLNEGKLNLPTSSNFGISAERIAIGQPDLDSYRLPEDCGRYLVNRIFGGTTSNPYEFPWIVQIAQIDHILGRSGPTCHGSIINKRYILTSASCVLAAPLRRHFIRVGAFTPFLFIGIEHIIIHELYDRNTLRNDIALIRVDRDIIFNDFVQPVCLPVTPKLRNQTLKIGIVAGWGPPQFNVVGPDVLRKATVPIIGKEECRRSIKPFIYLGDEVICSSGSGQPNACGWDQGTALGYVFRYRESIRFVQYGLVFAQGCENAPSTYTYIPNYVEWIMANLRPRTCQCTNRSTNK